ncbi:non-ribosomal peptide synthetase [Telmatobacter bradus]|uniref:non-ribosomal peptide synthetase n=1 Tax=Telmatobacter bradus TaxID=474953 RepID=UPI003B428BC0
MSSAAPAEAPLNQPADGKTIAALFTQQAARTPDRVALIACDRQLTYAALDAESNRIAHQLLALGVTPDTLVGVAMERTAALLVALIGTLKAGAAYVPLDPGYPQERLAFVLQDAELRVLLTSHATRQRLQLSTSGLTLIDVEDPALATQNALPAVSAATEENLAYVLYTSGSTGKPKGVMIEQRNVTSFFAAMDEALGCEPGVWLSVTSVSFDISVLELFWTLTRGFTVVLHGDEGSHTLADEIERHQVTHLQMTPSLARMLTLDARAMQMLGNLKKILLGGEALSAALVRQLRTVFAGDLYNMYGPTETTIWSTYDRIATGDEAITLGHAILGTQVCLLDANHAQVAAGEAGELCISGPGVARGYWKRPELTAERFAALPALASGRIYRTGDLARMLPDGRMEFLGRTDDQVKLRGHRIELGEIEALLEREPGVRQAVVVLREDRPGDQRLVAYVVAATHDAAALRTQLAAHLPDFMVPSAIVFRSELPLTSNGKTNRKALRELPAPEATLAVPTPQTHAANELEAQITSVWQDALGLAHVGLDDNFFDLGAHSLSMAEAHANLKQKLNRSIELVDLFQYTTVRTLAAHLAGTQTSSSISDRAARRRMARTR